MTYTLDLSPGERSRGCQALVTVGLPKSRELPILLVLYALAYAAASWVLPSSEVATATLLAVFTTTTVLLALRADTRSRLRRGRSADPHEGEPYHVAVTAEGIRTWCEHIDTHYNWNAIRDYKESPEFVLFLHGTGGGVFLPKRLFTDQALTSLRTDIQAWAPSLAISPAPPNYEKSNLKCNNQLVP